MSIDVGGMFALLRFIVRERAHPECPPEKRFVSRMEEIPGEWGTRAEAERAVIAWILNDAAKGEK